MPEPCNWHSLNNDTHPGRGWWAERRVMKDGRVLWLDIASPVLQFCYSDGRYIGSRKNILEARALCERGVMEPYVMGMPDSPLSTTDQQYKEKKIKPILKWEEVDKNNWHAAPVEGEHAHARIRRLDEKTHAVYRDCKYLGSEPTLAMAKMRAELNCLSERNRCMVLWEHAHPNELPPFAVMTTEEKAEWHRRNNIKPYPGFGRAGGPAPARPVKEPAAGRPAKQPKPSELDPQAALTVLNSKNPKKAGSAAHGRWSLLLEGGHATVKDFLEKGGNPETLKNAVAKGYVRLGGGDAT